MNHLNITQAQMVRLTGWPKSTANHLYNHRQDYNPALVKAAAEALKLEPFELFLHPREALQIRRLREAVAYEAETIRPGA